MPSKGHNHSWTDEDCERLRHFVRSGASPLRAAAALKRSVQVTKNKARELGAPFKLERERRQKLRVILRD